MNFILTPLRILFLGILFLVNPAYALENKELVVVSSINPIYQILEDIGQGKFQHHLLIKPDSSEHDYSLKQSDLEALSKADVIFYVDDLLEKNLIDWVKENRSQIAYQISRADGLNILYRKKEPKLIDYHLWLNPENGIAIANFVTKELCKKDAKNCRFFQNNLQKFNRKTLDTIKKIKDSLKQNRFKNFAIYHDAYSYFENYFDLEPKLVIAGQDGQQISSSKASQLADLVKNKEISCIISSSNVGAANAKILADNFDLKFIKIDENKAANPKDGENIGYTTVLQNIANSFLRCN